MQKITFVYKGKERTGQIISSTNLEPHYHWFYVNDEEITHLINDDCIGFKRKGGKLIPTQIFNGQAELVETIKQVVESYVN